MKQVNLRFLRFHCLDRDHCAIHYKQLTDAIIRRFEQQHPAVRIDSTIMRNWYQLMYTLNKKLPTDEGPDIFHTNGGGELEALVRQGLVYDLSCDLDDGWRDIFNTASFHPLTFNGREYAIPLEQGFVFVWYNKTIFARFGFSVPQTFDDLLDICRQLRQAGIIPFSIGNKERWPGAFFFCHLFHRIGGEDVFVADFTRSPRYDHIKHSFISAAEKLQQTVDAGAFHQDCNYTNYPEQRRQLIDGSAAMQLNGTRLLDYLKAEGPDILQHLDIFPFPLVPGGCGDAATYFGGSLSTYALSSRSRHIPEAVAFLRTLTDKQSERAIITSMGDVPATRHISCGDYPSAIQGRMSQLLQQAKRIHVHYFKYLAPQPAAVYLNMVAKLFDKSITAQEAFISLEEALLQESAKKTTHNTKGNAI